MPTHPRVPAGEEQGQFFWSWGPKANSSMCSRLGEGGGHFSSPMLLYGRWGGWVSPPALIGVVIYHQTTSTSFPIPASGPPLSRPKQSQFCCVAQVKHRAWSAAPGVRQCQFSLSGSGFPHTSGVKGQGKGKVISPLVP